MDLNQTSDQMEMFGYTAEGAQQEADKFVGEAGNLEEDISKAASSLVPFYDSGVNIANVAQEYMKPEQERDYDYIKSQFTEAGQSAAIEGGLLLMGGVAGKYGAKGIKALADKVKQYEIDPTAMSAFGAGAIRIKPKKTKPFKLEDMYRVDFDWGRLNLTDSQVAELANVEKSVLAAGGGQKAVEAAEKRVQDAIDARIPVIAEALKYKLKTSDKGVVSLDAYKDAVEATVRFDTIEEAAESISNQRGILNKMGPGMMDNMLFDDRSMTAFEQLPDNEIFQYIFDEGLDRALVDWAVKEEAIRKSYNKYTKAANKNIKTFKEGGAVMDDQMQMAFMDEGGIIDDDLDVDPVSGNEVPPGSLAEEVRDDIPAQLSEGEYVVPADVVRYYGVKFFEDLRDQAKMGLADMEANGRIGGEPVPAGGPINDEELSEQEMSAIRQMMTGMAEGGEVQNPYLQQQQLYSQPRPAPIDEKRNTTITGINPVENQMPMQSMASGGQVQGYQDSSVVTQPDDDIPSFAQNQMNPAQYGLGFSFMGQPQQTAATGTTTSQAPQGQSFTVLYHPEYATNGRSKTFYLPRDSAVYQEYLGMGYTKQMPMTGPAGQGETPTTTDTPVTTDLTGSTVTTGSGRRGGGGSKPPTTEKVDYSTYDGEKLLEAFDQNRKTRIALTALGAINPMLALFGQGATRAQEKDILAAMKAKGIKPPENEGGIVDNITDFVSGLFGKDKEEVMNTVVQQSKPEPEPITSSSAFPTGRPALSRQARLAAEDTKAAAERKYKKQKRKTKDKKFFSSQSGKKSLSSSEKKKLDTRKSKATDGYKGGRAEGGLMNKKGKK